MIDRKKKPKKGRVYRTSDSRREGLIVLVEKASHSTGFAHVLNDQGRRYTVRLDRFTPKNHWHFVGEAPEWVGSDGFDLHHFND